MPATPRESTAPSGQHQRENGRVAEFDAAGQFGGCQHTSASLFFRAVQALFCNDYFKQIIIILLLHSGSKVLMAKRLIILNIA